jgi:GDPmannose 4,6-dehydratase
VGLQNCLYLGNLDAKRDWGHAKDYVKMQWLMLQQPTPEDYVIATGEQHSVREFVELSAKELGFEIEWKGTGVEEVGIVKEAQGAPVKNDGISEGHKAQREREKRIEEREGEEQEKVVGKREEGGLRQKDGDIIIRIDPRYFRPTEVDTLLGDASKAKERLGWTPRISFNELVKEMVEKDLELAKRDAFVKDKGFKVLNGFE